MAIVVGSFPLKRQVEEFQKALRNDNAYHVVVEEKVTEKDKSGKNERLMPAFRFLGFNVRRREVGPDGKPTGEFVNLDFVRPYMEIMSQVLMEPAPEDPKVEKLLFAGLVQRRPVQIPLRDKTGEKTSKPYPNIEEALPKIKETLTALTPVQTAPVASNSKFDILKEFDAFGNTNAPATDTGNITPAAPAEWVPPSHCVLRFLDVTIKPGHTYEYQVQVRMANPNLNKSDAEVAYHELTTMPELTSAWYDVKTGPGPDAKMLQVRVPTDLHYYAVDEKALKKRDYKGMNAREEPKPSQAVVQIHHWTDYYEWVRSRSDFFPVGDWLIGERLFIYRGESLSARAPAHVPVWAPERNTFALAGKAPTTGRDRTAVAEVTFIQDRDRAPLLVDFEGGNVSYVRRPAVPKSEDGTPEPGAKAPPPTEIKSQGTATELLFLTPDGKLLARNSAVDEEDQDRKKREEEYVGRVEEASGKPPEAPKPMP
jgi:hypothetical protein